jgi:Spy/CpxP family protein refolding chaperone
MSHITLRHLLLPFTFALAVPAFGAGCGSAATHAASPDQALRAPLAVTLHGPVKVVGDALGDVPLRPDQRAQIEQLATDTEARHAESLAARKDLTLAIADQVQSGHIDRAALAPKIDALAAALQKAQPSDRASVDKLHEILTPDQRVEFVDALEAHIGEHRSEAKGKHPLKQWAEDLKLSDDQKNQIRAALRSRMQGVHDGPGAQPHEHGEHGGEHPWAEGRERGAKLLAAFKQDHFVLDEVAPAKDVSKRVAKMSDRILSMAETVVPLLTPEQRSIAAQKLRERAESGGPLGPGGGATL